MGDKLPSSGWLPFKCYSNHINFFNEIWHIYENICGYHDSIELKKTTSIQRLKQMKNHVIREKGNHHVEILASFEGQNHLSVRNKKVKILSATNLSMQLQNSNI